MQWLMFRGLPKFAPSPPKRWVSYNPGDRDNSNSHHNHWIIITYYVNSQLLRNSVYMSLRYTWRHATTQTQISKLSMLLHVGLVWRGAHNLVIWYEGLMWSLFLIKHLFLTGVWQGYLSIRNAKKTHVMVRLYTIWGSLINMFGRAYAIVSREWEFSRSTSCNFCLSTPVLKLETTIFVIWNCSSNDNTSWFDPTGNIVQGVGSAHNRVMHFSVKWP